jgi:hypothetical protein
LGSGTPDDEAREQLLSFGMPFRETRPEYLPHSPLEVEMINLRASDARSDTERPGGMTAVRSKPPKQTARKSLP